jgi:hypothetical protein
MAAMAALAVRRILLLPIVVAGLVVCGERQARGPAVGGHYRAASRMPP